MNNGVGQDMLEAKLQKRQLHWFDHVQRTEDNTTVKSVPDWIFGAEIRRMTTRHLEECDPKI